MNDRVSQVPCWADICQEPPLGMTFVTILCTAGSGGGTRGSEMLGRKNRDKKESKKHRIVTRRQLRDY